MCVHRDMFNPGQLPGKYMSRQRATPRTFGEESGLGELRKAHGRTYEHGFASRKQVDSATPQVSRERTLPVRKPRETLPPGVDPCASSNARF